MVIPKLRKALAATSKEGQRTDIDTQISSSAGLRVRKEITWTF